MSCPQWFDIELPTDQFSVKYMIQQRTTKKAHVDVHCTGVVYKYAGEFAESICI